jgi:hypothetical protein
MLPKGRRRRSSPRPSSRLRPASFFSRLRRWYSESLVAVTARHVLRGVMFTGLMIYAATNFMDYSNKEFFLLAAFVLAAPEFKGWTRKWP